MLHARVRRLVPAWLPGPRAGGLTDLVVALGDVRGPTGGLDVRRGGGGHVAVELVQVPADGVPAVPVARAPRAASRAGRRAWLGHARDRRGKAAVTFAISVGPASGAGGRRSATCYLIVYW